MEIKRTLQIDAPVEEVWQILGPDYADVGEWASSVYVSRGKPGKGKVAEAPVRGRVCQTSLGPFDELIEEYDENAKVIRYSAKSAKLPGFVKNLGNRWELSASRHGTEAKLALGADISFPFNLIFGPIMKLQFAKAVDQTLDELKYYAETGAVHPRKAEIDATDKAAKGRAALASS